MSGEGGQDGKQIASKRFLRYKPGYSPSSVLHTVTNTYQAFESSGLFLHASDSLAWMSPLSEVQQAVLQFCGSLLSGSPAIEELLEKEVKAEFLIAAEAVLCKPSWQDLNVFDLAHCSVLHQRQLAQPEIPAPAPPPDAAPAQVVVPPPAPAQGEAALSYMPDVEEEPQALEIPVESFFSALVLTDMQKDVLKRVPLQKLQQVIEHAKLRNHGWRAVYV